MASPGYKARILNGDFSLSPKLSEASGALSVEMLDVTTFADDGDKRFIPGLDSSMFTAKGFIDAAAHTDSAAWTSAQPFTYGPLGFALGSPVQMVNSLRSKFEIGTQVGSVASFDLEGTTDGLTNFGVSVHDLAAETADGNGTSYDGGAATTNGGTAHLHVTAFSGLTSALVTIEDSATGSGGWATVATFTSATAVTSERVTIAGTIRRYLRAVTDVTGTGSVTYACFLARH